MQNSSSFRPGRGAQINTANPYHQLAYDELPDPEDELRTQYIPTYPKTILNKITSPDIGAGYGLNPYQGCEHGCVYCFARTTHTYWGYSAGLDFEQKILYKADAPKLLRQTLLKKSYDPQTIMLSGNTDAYQPAERKFSITRQILQVLSDLEHPVGLITKNSLVVRDLDILRPMAEKGLVHASISITTLNEETRRFLEPRTASIVQRFKAVKALSDVGIPVNVMIAPVIPGLTEHEILPIAERAAAAGACKIGYTIVRLNDEIADIFTNWIHQAFPDRAEKVLNRIRDCRGGNLGEKRFGKRHRGEGESATMINQQYQLAKRLYFPDTVWPPYNFELFERRKRPQLSLFE
ncbi:MAG: PA0069 family radical SAM protein [Bacteroidota bacterium]